MSDIFFIVAYPCSLVRKFSSSKAYKIYDKSAEYKKQIDHYETGRKKLEKENENNNDLFNKYEDYRGWIKVDNTNMDSPIVLRKR